MDLSVDPKVPHIGLFLWTWPWFLVIITNAWRRSI